MALTLTVSCTSILSLISPWLAVWSPYALLGGRICTGLLEVRFVQIKLILLYFLLLTILIISNSKTHLLTTLTARSILTNYFADDFRVLHILVCTFFLQSGYPKVKSLE